MRARKFFTTATVLAVASTGLAVVAATPAEARADRDCGDFPSQRRAQIFFLKHGGPQSDPHRLDEDGDEIACETNPPPYYYGTTLPGGGGGGGGGHHGHQKPRIEGKARVTHVVDGDTIDVRMRHKKYRIRLVGIDTPEVYGGVECGGPAASRAMKERLPRGTVVKLTADMSQDDKDRYGRLLRYVSKAGHDLNRRQIAAGHARVYVYNHNPFKRVDSYRKAEAAAKKHDRGLWGSCRRHH